MVFRLELRHQRWNEIDAVADPLFQLAFPNVDRLGRETATQSFLLQSTPSIYISARLAYKEYEYSIQEDTTKVCLLQDPFLELAETLLAVRNGRNQESHSLSLREDFSLRSCSEYFSDVDTFDPRELRRSLARMPATVESALFNPFARLLSAKTAGETLTGSHISASIASLATFDVVGVRDRPESFIAPFCELLGVEPDALQMDAPESAAINLAGVLRSIPIARGLVEMDLRIYEAVQAAIKSAF
jgi:hypothetical protein